MPVAALAEMDSLTAWADWAQLRTRWLHDRLVAGDLPVGWSVGGEVIPVATATAPTPTGTLAPPVAEGVPAPAPPHPGMGTLLLVGGAVLLVLAGIAFAAVAWDLLGPIGQLMLLYLIGAVALLAGLRLHLRLPVTATTLGVVGVLLVAVSCVATRVLGANPMGAPAALAVSVAAALLLGAVGLWLRDRMRGVGEVAALVGAALTLGLLASAPADEALSFADPWLWWPAAVLLVGGVALLLVHPRVTAVTWPALASVSLLIGSGTAAVFVAAESPVDDPLRPFVGSVVLLLLAAFAALLVRVLSEHRPEPEFTAAALVAVAGLVALAAGLGDSDSRPWSALTLAAVAGFTWWARTHTPPGVRSALTLVSSAALGAAVGFAVVPWTPDWATWHGPLAAAALSAVLVVLAEVGGRSGSMTGLPALVAAGTGLVVLLMAITPVEGGTPSDAALWALVAALSLVAVAGWVEVLRRRLPTWSSWLSGGLLVGALVPLSELTDVDSRWAPEFYGLALGVVVGAAGALFWWVRRPARTPSLVTVGPALTLALAPTTVAMALDAVDRWDLGDGAVTTDYQVRVVALLVVCAALVAVGAWRGWAGVVIPAALALIVVTAVQLVDLGRFLPQWVSFAVAGGLLVLAGARWEKVRTLSRAGGHWLRHLH
jgi:hypothetical protein